ncbi:MAG: hypothetical protein DRP42_06920 [Tenericutes bacterium]|nr:MAG: hypothetical protein DRP42_06920 [Mycoplasmatota bacterium]
MSRAEKNWVDFFPFKIKEGKTLAVLERRYKAAGTGFFINMLRILGNTPDHHLCLENEADRIYFFDKTLVDEKEGIEMLNLMSVTGKIDRKLWEERQVIASKDFLVSLERAYAKRQILPITIEQICNLFGVEYEAGPEDAKEDQAIREGLLKDTVMHKQIAGLFTLTPAKVKIELTKFLDQYSASDMGNPKQVKAAFIKELQRFKKFRKNEQPTEGEM